MDWTMGDEAVKVQLFRFVDVLPLLHDPAGDRRPPARIPRRGGRRGCPGWLRLGAAAAARAAGSLGRLLATVGRVERRAAGPAVHRRLEPRRGARGRRRAAPAVAGLHRRPARRSDHHRGRGRAVPAAVPRPDRRPDAARSTPGRTIPLIDRDDRGPIPRVNVSVKLSACTASSTRSTRTAPAGPSRDRLRPILRAGPRARGVRQRRHGAVRLQGPDAAHLPRVLDEPEFRDWPDVGIAVQAYLRDTEARPATSCATGCERRGTPVWVRLVKGAYWDYETVIAGPAAAGRCRSSREKWRDRRQLRAADAVPAGEPRAAAAGVRQPQRPQPGPRDGRGRGAGRAAAALRDPDALRHGRPDQGRAGRPGPAGPRLHALRRSCCRAWRTWSGGCWRTRRTSRSCGPASAEHVPEEQLLHESRAASEPCGQPVSATEWPRADAVAGGAAASATSRSPTSAASENRAGDAGRRSTTSTGSSAGPTRWSSAASEVDHRRRRSTRSTRRTRSEVVGRVAKATAEHAEQAIAAAADGVPGLARHRPERAGRRTCVKAADVDPRAALRAGRLGGLRVRQALARGRRRRRRGDRLLRVLRPRDAPAGRAAAARRRRARTNEYFYEPRGVAVVIAPWNFPLAILTRHDRRGAGRRQHGRPEAGRAVAGDRRAS